MPKIKSHKNTSNLSKEDQKDLKKFNLFRDECNKWIDKFNLNDWEITYEFTNSLEDNAICRANVSAKIASLVLCSGCSDDNIKINALHEVLELLLFTLTDLASNRKWDEESWDSSVHSIIHRIQNVLLSNSK